MTDQIPKMPEFVKVGFRQYRIVEWSPRGAMAEGCSGQCDLTMAEIRVFTGLGWNKAANTLLHEVLHAVWYFHGLSDDDNQERYVNVIANGLSAVWVDNPDVITWINDGLRSPG